MARKVDWERIKTEYITGDIGQRKIAEKYGVSVTTLSSRAKSEKWYRQKCEYKDKVVEKAIRKAANKKADAISKELKVAAQISTVLDKALKDPKQFNRYVLTESVGDGMTQTVEYVFDKTDMKALRDAAYALQTVVKIQRDIRSMDMVLDADKREQLKLARRKLELDERRANVTEADEDTTGVVIVAEVLNEESGDEE